MIFTSLSTFSCERPEEQIKRDKGKYGLISKERPVGTNCYVEDTASIKRRSSHPRNPTGGWRLKAEIDTSRHHDKIKNDFDLIGGEIAGCVHFPVSGKLAVRSYDDVYGSVYCGWSPSFVEYKVQQKPIYVVFPTCSVGDGGLDQVHEICWFPENDDEGIVLYSSAHTKKTELKAHEIFLPRHFGPFYQQGDKKYFSLNDHEADRIFDSMLIAGQLDQAKVEISRILDRLEHLAPVIDGSTRKPIPTDQFYCDEWVKILFLKSGVDLFNPAAKDSLSKAREIITNGNKYCFQSPYAIDLIDFYEWTVMRVQGSDIPTPQTKESANRVHGYDPRRIAKILSDPRLSDSTLKKSALTHGGQSTYFWLGIREYLSDNANEAYRYLSLYINHPNRGSNDFELSAAASLLAKMKQN